MEIQFQASSPFIKQRRSDKGWIIEFECDQSQYDLIKDLPTPQFEDKVLVIIVKDE